MRLFLLAVALVLLGRPAKAADDPRDQANERLNALRGFSTLAGIPATPENIRSVLIGEWQVPPDKVKLESIIVAEAADAAVKDPATMKILSVEDVMTAFARITSVVTRLSICRVLMAKKGKECVSTYLLSVLDHPSASMCARLIAASLLLNCDRLEGYETVRKGLSVPDPINRRFAAEILGDFASHDGRNIDALKTKIDIKRDLEGLSEEQRKLFEIRVVCNKSR